MYNASLYSKCNRIQQTITKDLLNNYGSLIKWKKDILDIGCAEGATLMKVVVPNISSKDFAITGIDQSDEMIKKAREQYKNEKNVEFLHVAIDDPNLLNVIKKKFDNIVSFHVMHFVPNQELAFRKIFQMLKPNGQIFLVRMPFAPSFQAYHCMSKEPNAPDYLLDRRYCEFYTETAHNHSLVIKSTAEFLNKFGFTKVQCAIEPISYKCASMEELMEIQISVNPYWKSVPNNMKGSHFQKFLSHFLKNGVKIEFDEDTEKINFSIVLDFLVTIASKS